MKRRVICVKKDRDGDITHVGNPSQHWSPRSLQDVINDIKYGRYSYYVSVGGYNVDIHVVDNRYLRTNPDGKGRNNLDDLPNC